MTLGTRQWEVRELNLLSHAPQHQPTATHIAAPHELRGKHQFVSENAKEWLDIFRRGNAAQQDDLAVCAHLIAEQASVPFQRHTVARIRSIQLARNNRAEFVKLENSIGRDEAARSGDHRNTGNSRRRISVSASVGEFAPKIETADQCENLAQLDACRSKALRERRFA